LEGNNGFGDHSAMSIANQHAAIIMNYSVFEVQLVQKSINHNPGNTKTLQPRAFTVCL
jgi:hypothetical protein